jgi:plasmid replication initiation protein
MGISDKYPLYKELNRRVITPAVKQLNENSNLTVTFKTKKKGCRIVGLRFEFKVDEQMQLSLGEPQNAALESDDNTRDLVAKYRPK